MNKQELIDSITNATGESKKAVSEVLNSTIDTTALLTPNEVAEIFRVNPKTVTRWAQSGKISAIRTLGGHRRFNAAEIMRHLEEQKSA